jgi:hypothetical protein
MEGCSSAHETPADVIYKEACATALQVIKQAVPLGQEISLLVPNEDYIDEYLSKDQCSFYGKATGDISIGGSKDLFSTIHASFRTNYQGLILKNEPHAIVVTSNQAGPMDYQSESQWVNPAECPKAPLNAAEDQCLPVDFSFIGADEDTDCNYECVIPEFTGFQEVSFLKPLTSSCAFYVSLDSEDVDGALRPFERFLNLLVPSGYMWCYGK